MWQSRCSVLPIKAMAREPAKQAGYIKATSNVLEISTCDTQPVHTLWHKSAKKCVILQVCFAANIRKRNAFGVFQGVSRNFQFILPILFICLIPTYEDGGSTKFSFRSLILSSWTSSIVVPLVKKPIGSRLPFFPIVKVNMVSFNNALCFKRSHLIPEY